MSKENSHISTMVNRDGAAILDTKVGTISTLNPTGAYVWQALERGEDMEMITANLVRETGEQMDTVKNDVQEFIDALKKQHLLPY